MAVLYYVLQYLGFVLMFINLFALSHQILKPNFGSDLCASECVKKVSISSNNVNIGDSCARGCRFYYIAELMFDGNSSRDACCRYCEESYRHSEVDLIACKTGCTAALPRIPFEVPVIAEVSWSLFIDGDISEEDETVTDPMLKRQLTKIADVHLPEMKIRTLPMKSKVSEQQGWDCRRGVSHCLLGSLLLLLVVLALLLGVLLEDHTPHHDLSPPHLHKLTIA